LYRLLETKEVPFGGDKREVFNLIYPPAPLKAGVMEPFRKSLCYCYYY
jgi:hypothetical protein